MAIVTLSRQLGAGGFEIATGVARALGLRIIDREAIDRAAMEAGVPEIALHELGYEVEMEKNILNRRVDVLASANGLRFAIEVEMEEFDLVHETELLGVVDFLFIVCKDEHIYLKKVRELKDLKISNTKVYKIDDFLRITYNEYREIKGKNSFSGNKSISPLFLGNLLNLRGKARIGKEKD